jgi:hypothetical protein
VQKPPSLAANRIGRVHRGTLQHASLPLAIHPAGVGHGSRWLRLRPFSATCGGWPCPNGHSRLSGAASQDRHC